MELIRRIVFLLLLPAVTTYGQTAHVDSNKIVYKGTINPGPISGDELYARAKNAILNNVKGSKRVTVTDNREKGMMSAMGSIRLASPYPMIKTVEYILELSIDNGKCKYRIDSIYLRQVERGGKTIRMSSEELLKGMEVSGALSASVEKQLNEIDMNFQKLIDLVSADIKKTPVVKMQ